MTIGKHAHCPKCDGFFFQIGDKGVLCLTCQTVYQFDFIDSDKTICETKADDMVLMIEGG